MDVKKLDISYLHIIFLTPPTTFFLAYFTNQLKPKVKINYQSGRLLSFNKLFSKTTYAEIIGFLFLFQNK